MSTSFATKPFYQHFCITWTEAHGAQVQSTYRNYKSEKVLYRREIKKGIYYQTNGYSYATVYPDPQFDKILQEMYGNIKISARILIYKDTKKTPKITSYAIGRLHKERINIMPQIATPGVSIKTEKKIYYISEDGKLVADDV